MKFLIDTEKKVITLEQSTNLSEFAKVIMEMLGSDWTKYTLEKTVTINWHSPVNINPITYKGIPSFPSITTRPLHREMPTIICFDDTKKSDVVVTSYMLNK